MRLKKKKKYIETPVSQFSPSDNSKKRIFSNAAVPSNEPYISKRYTLLPLPQQRENNAEEQQRIHSNSRWTRQWTTLHSRDRLTGNVDRKVGKRTLIYANLLATLYLNRD